MGWIASYDTEFFYVLKELWFPKYNEIYKIVADRNYNRTFNNVVTILYNDKHISVYDFCDNTNVGLPFNYWASKLMLNLTTGEEAIAKKHLISKFNKEKLINLTLGEISTVLNTEPLKDKYAWGGRVFDIE